MARTMKHPSLKVGTKEEKMTSGHRGEVEPEWVVPTKARPWVPNALQTSGDTGTDQNSLESKKSIQPSKAEGAG